MSCNNQNTLDLSKMFLSAEELLEPEKGKIEGEIPAWLKGSFWMLGPGLFDIGDFTMNHWMDGFATITKFTINSNEVTLESRFLKSDAYLKAQYAQKPVLPEFGTRAFPDPSKNIVSRFSNSIFSLEMTDNSCGNLFQIGRNLYASGDNSYFHQINDSLETLEKFDSTKLFGLNSFVAHPLKEAETGDVFILGSSAFPTIKNKFIKIHNGDLKNYTQLCAIPSRWSSAVSYNHTFAMTKNYLVFIEQPLTVSLSKIASLRIKGDSIKNCFEWKSEERNKFFIVEKKSGKVRGIDYFSSKSFFFLHIANSYEEDNQIVLDLNAFPNADIFENFYIDNLRSGKFKKAEVTFRRFVIPIINNIENVPFDTNLVKTKCGCKAEAQRKGNSIIIYPEDSARDEHFGNVAYNRKYMGKKVKYYYANCSVDSIQRNVQIPKVGNNFLNGITKFSFPIKKIDEELRWTGEAEERGILFPSEPIFVPRSSREDEDEDDGILIAAVSDPRTNHQDFLTFLDPKCMKEVGRIIFKNRITPSIHANFIPSS